MSIRTLVENVQVDKICYMDDIKMFDTSLAGLGRKVAEIKGLAKLVGLEIHDAKSGVLTDRYDSKLDIQSLDIDRYYYRMFVSFF